MNNIDNRLLFPLNSSYSLDSSEARNVKFVLRVALREKVMCSFSQIPTAAFKLPVELLLLSSGTT